jgi:hypothetical protein
MQVHCKIICKIVKNVTLCMCLALLCIHSHNFLHLFLNFWGRGDKCIRWYKNIVENKFLLGSFVFKKLCTFSFGKKALPVVFESIQRKFHKKTKNALQKKCFAKKCFSENEFALSYHQFLLAKLMMGYDGMYSVL